MLEIYKYNKKPFVEINEIQIDALKKFDLYVSKGLLTYQKNICPCKSENSELLSERCRYGIKVSYQICKNCSLVRQDPILTEKSLILFYKDLYREIYTGKIDIQNKEHIFSEQYKSGNKYYDFLDKILEGKKKKLANYAEVLEIGSSCGGIVSYFQDKGHKVTAMDYDENYLNFALLKGIKNIYNDLSKIKKKFDLIILSHSFEHFLNLENKLNEIKNLLNDDGIVFFDIPGIFNRDYYHLRNLLYNPKKIHFLYHLQNAHTYYFSSETFKDLINKISNFGFIYIDQKIYAILENKKNEMNSNINNTNYKKINKFIYFNNIRYHIFNKLIFIIVPMYSFYKKLKKFMPIFFKKN